MVISMRRVRKGQILTAGLAALLTGLLAAGCGADSRVSQADTQGYRSEADHSAYNLDTDYAMTGEDSYETEAGLVSADSPSESSAGLSSSQDLQARDSSRKLIRYQSLTLETRKFDTVTEWIQTQVKSAGGYVENSNISGSADSAGTRYASYTLRIPTAGLDDFTEALKQEGTVTSYSENVEDVTLSYTDTESHIAALKTEQETLMEMLSQSGDLDTLLAIQERLTDIRYQLENYESQLRIYDNDIDYSTIYVTLREVEREKAVENDSFGSQIKEHISSGFYNFGKGAQAFLLGFLGLLPLWILLAVIGLVAGGIVRRVRGKKKGDRHRGKKNQDRPGPGDQEGKNQA